LLAAPAAIAGIVVSAPVDVIGNFAASHSSPPTDTALILIRIGATSLLLQSILLIQARIFVSSFSYGTSTTSSGANVFRSTNGGTSWTSLFTVPAPANGVGIPKRLEILPTTALGYYMVRYLARTATSTKAPPPTRPRLLRGATLVAGRQLIRPYHSRAQINPGSPSAAAGVAVALRRLPLRCCRARRRLQ